MVLYGIQAEEYWEYFSQTTIVADEYMDIASAQAVLWIMSFLNNKINLGIAYI